LQVFFLAAIEQMFDTLPKTLREDFGPARQIITQDPTLVPDLITCENKRHGADAHDQGQDNFQSRAHLGSSIQKNEKWTARTGGCGHVELRNASYSFSKNLFLLFLSLQHLETRTRSHNDMNGDVPAICRAVLDGGLSARLELSFDLRVLTIGDLDGKSSVPNRGNFPRLGWVVWGWSQLGSCRFIKDRPRPDGYIKHTTNSVTKLNTARNRLGFLAFLFDLTRARISGTNGTKKRQVSEIG